MTGRLVLFLAGAAVFVGCLLVMALGDPPAHGNPPGPSAGTVILSGHRDGGARRAPGRHLPRPPAGHPHTNHHRKAPR